MKEWIPAAGLAGTLLLVVSQPAGALELRRGTGEFAMDASLNSVMEVDADVDVTTWTLAEPHLNLFGTPFFLRFRGDYFDSDAVNRKTDMLSRPLTEPMPGTDQSVSDLVAEETSVPVPADYRLHGVNVDLGLGYDVFRNDQGYLGVAVNTGASGPFMKIRNLSSDGSDFTDALDDFDTQAITYKLGGTLLGRYQLTPWLGMEGSFNWSHQTGEMENDLLGSGVDVDGQYRTYNLALKVKPAKLLPHAPLVDDAFLTVGYTATRWDYDATEVTTPVGDFRFDDEMLDVGFDHTSAYVGFGYDF